MNLQPLAAVSLVAAVFLAGCAAGPSDAIPTTTATATPSTVPVTGTMTSDDFENASVGAVPAGWTVVSGNWSVVENATGPAGAHVLLSDQTALGETTILDDAAGSWSDVEASVRFNVLAGEKGQAGGIIFRYEDADNYYVVRYNHNELSWNLFRTMDGNREKFPGTDESADAFHGALHQWTELRVVAEGAHIRVFSGDVLVIDYTEEDADAPAAGKIGLWTRYDSKTEFDAFTVGPP